MQINISPFPLIFILHSNWFLAWITFVSVYSLYPIPEEKSAAHCAVFVLLKIIKALLLFHKGSLLSEATWPSPLQPAKHSTISFKQYLYPSLHPHPTATTLRPVDYLTRSPKPYLTSSQPHYYSSTPPQHSFRRDSIGEFLIHKGKYAAIFPAFSPSCHQATHHLSLRTA